jgi:signal transduction histidine kinase
LGVSRREGALGVAGLVAGAAAQAAAGFDAADLATGWCVAAAGLALWRWRRRAGQLLYATGLLWFAGNFDAALLFVHRGPLLHVLFCWPSGRGRRPLVVAAYVAALIAPLWENEPATLALAGAMAAAAVRRPHDVARGATLVLAAVLAAGALARLAFAYGEADAAALLAYELVVAGVALALASAGQRPLIDLVVELGERPSAPLRDALAEALGDETLQIAHRDAAIPDGRATTPLGADLVLIHRPLDDARLAAAVRIAARMADEHTRLQDGVREQLTALEASRRRLLAAGDAERERLEQRLRTGTGRRLERLAGTLARADEHGADVARAIEVLARARDDLEVLARGLHPAHLAEAGLAAAVGELARGAPVTLDIAAGLGPEVEPVVYYVCAEALANVTKYASATRVEITVRRDDGRVVVSIADDGVGGADPDRGTGLRGLRDRLEAQGGQLAIDSPAGGGTRLQAELPC